MDKIESLGGGLFRKKTKKKRVKGGSPAARTFKSLLSSAAPAQGEVDDGLPEAYQTEDVAALLDEVHSRGEALSDVPSMEHIKAYKDAVQAFLKLALSKMAAVEEKTSGVNILKRKRYTLISVINKKLEILIVSVLKNQEEQMSILEKVEEINGLIVNLLT
jgi:uncharacterized protein YaaR (DUF327 family)